MINKMKTAEQKYIRAKKCVDKIKKFYTHFAIYIVVNIFISAVVIFGMMNDGYYDFWTSISHFGVYSTWLFWGIGLFFHWLSTFGSNLFLGKNWEERKINEYINETEK
ncbi:2TM domain-containing protein [Tenacibaculum finnmarkense]|nr:2TM domain-containing protein [Tenacibaculum finnmarkense genomovar finnmarkense]MCG8724002.1 2TM domain-containing protein [Tenacibaculum finnmarkense]MCG8742321.1 2TM domain-containing protein [Tenacibaculum finnmarkense]MCG8765697.1 2TM domain-containing protein [Tenacibaculum finnmarkense]MCG8778619.1 2TM domain-containing protein [Tenacibaculum finnmarkense]